MCALRAPEGRDSIKQPEEPEWDAVAVADFEVIDCKVAVGDVLDLAERFLATTDLEEVFSIDEEIACFRCVYLMADLQLIQKEGLAQGTCSYVASQSIHQIRVVKKNLLWPAQMLEGFRGAVEDAQKSRPRKSIEHFQRLVAVRVQLCAKLAEVRCLRHAFCQNLKHLFCLLDGGDSYRLKNGIITLQNAVDRLLETQVEAPFHLPVERIVAKSQILLEEGQDSCFATDVHSDFRVF